MDLNQLEQMNRTNLNYNPRESIDHEPDKIMKVHERLNKDLEFFSRACLKIKPKAGPLEPFIFNKAQKYLHHRIEKHLKERGYVRVAILKGRQQGCSTYTAARFYHKATRSKNNSVYILSHEAATTHKLFNIVKRYHEEMPGPVKPGTIKDSDRSIVFSTNSDYTVGTAGNKNTGRGGTSQLFHGSEVGFYDNEDELQTGLLQSIADVPGTEIILESTANGMGNLFHKICMGALKGENDYELIFIPWFWQSEYYKEPPSDFEFTPAELKIVENYQLNPGQIYWRRMKIAGTFNGDEWKFKQEYPNNIQEAFQTSGDSMIDPQDIMSARKREPVRQSNAAKIGGCDPARDRDRFVIGYRQGRNFPHYQVHNPKTQGKLKGPQQAKMIADYINNHGLDKMFVDVTRGWEVVDFLHEMGYNKIVQGVNFSQGAMQPDRFLNKRAEMIINMGEWISSEEVSIPDDDAVHTDLAAIPKPKETSVGKLFIIPKEKITELLGMSTDISDMLALTFAFPVHYNIGQEVVRKKDPAKITNKYNPLKSRRRVSNRGTSNIDSIQSVNTLGGLWGQ